MSAPSRSGSHDPPSLGARRRTASGPRLQPRRSERGEDRASDGPATVFAREAIPELPRLWHHALWLTSGDRDLAQDLLHETYFLAWRARGSYAPGTNCGAWLKTILRRRHLGWCVTERRRERLERENESVLSPEADADEAERRETGLDPEVKEALHDLSPAHLQVLVLADLEGLTHEEISDILGVPPGTVKSRLFRARRRLRRRLVRYAVDRGFFRGRREGAREGMDRVWERDCGALLKEIQPRPQRGGRSPVTADSAGTARAYLTACPGCPVKARLERALERLRLPEA